MSALVCGYGAKLHRLRPAVMLSIRSPLNTFSQSQRDTFHESWFSASRINSRKTELKFDVSIEDQIHSLKTKGFAIVRSTASKQQLDDIRIVEKQVLDLVASSTGTWKYRLFCYFSGVRASECGLRHSIPLPSTPQLLSVLFQAVTSIRPLLASQLLPNSPLVELSSILSFPGAERQLVHTDIPYNDTDTILSGFIALTEVNLSNGIHLIS